MAQLKQEKGIISKLFRNQSKKKLIENLTIIVIVGLIMVIAGTSLFSRSSLETTRDPETQLSPNRSSFSYDYLELEQKIEELLSRIEGAGKVKLVITYESGGELVRATDVKESESITEEKDSQGGTRKMIQTDYESETVYDGRNANNSRPLIVKELYPPIKGVVIVAEGAGNITVKENLTRAAQVLLDIPIHKIGVFAARK